MQNNKQFSQVLGLSVVVVRNSKHEYLAVLETDDRGWWLPAGRVDPPETYENAAIRETLEEAGLKVQLKGILRLEHQVGRFKVIFYAEPINEADPVKTIADKESICSKWVHWKDLPKLRDTDEGLRGDELLQWANYIQNGGFIYPLQFLCKEGAPIKQ